MLSGSGGLPDYLFLMHDDVPPGAADRQEDWAAYIGRLRSSGHFAGGSAIGAGVRELPRSG